MRPIAENIFLAGDKDLDGGFAKSIALKTVANSLQNDPTVDNLRNVFIHDIKDGKNPIFEALKNEHFNGINAQTINSDLNADLVQKAVILDDVNNPFNHVSESQVEQELKSSINQHTLSVLNNIHIETIQQLNKGMDVEQAFEQGFQKHVVEADQQIENKQKNILTVALASQQLFNDLKNNPDNINFNAVYGDEINANRLEIGNGDISSITEYLKSETQGSNMVEIPKELHALAEIDSQTHDMGGVNIAIDQERFATLTANIDQPTIAASRERARNLMDTALNTVEKQVSVSKDFDSPSM
ncbi:hypothetical protein [Photobacterium leiognathi]|uniref:hypothetical protein n=1 Tax=Photobacterium leiognathi TaxID=553611 RepID=UPI0029821DD2|nr:hypothetical protein [Photobacterium leiognathi]